MNRVNTMLNKKHLLARAIVCGMLLVLPACGIPKYRVAEQGPPISATYQGAVSPDNSAQLGIVEFYNDPLLLSLIDQALVNNRELRILNEEIQVARSVIVQRRGAYLPFVGFRGVAELDKPSFFTPLGAAERELTTPTGGHFPDPLPDYLLTLNFFWQIDIWRELRNNRDSAIQRYMAVTEKRNYFVTRMVAEVAENYFGLMARDKRLENLDQIIDLQEKSLKIARSRLEAGRGTELAVQRFLAEVRKNQSQKLIVRQEIIEIENRINFLANRYPQPVERNTPRFFDVTFPLGLGVPVQLLLNRPDIRQAEREVAAAGLDVKVARAHFFPKLDITGGVGYEAFNPRYLFWTPDALIYNIAGEIVGPILNKTAIRAEYLSANAKQLQSVYSYQRVILDAFTQVVNRVTKVQNYTRSLEIKKQQLESLVASVEVASRLFQNARVEYIDILFAQRDLNDARATYIDTREQQLSAYVNTYQALGGGTLWSSQTGDLAACRGLPPAAPGQPGPMGNPVPPAFGPPAAPGGLAPPPAASAGTPPAAPGPTIPPAPSSTP